MKSEIFSTYVDIPGVEAVLGHGQGVAQLAVPLPPGDRHVPRHDPLHRAQLARVRVDHAHLQHACHVSTAAVALPDAS